MSKVVSAQKAAELIKDGDTVWIVSSGGGNRGTMFYPYRYRTGIFKKWASQRSHTLPFEWHR
jgi:exopolysaccharide biosynthesis predicted pyruvyltransferase EpsI